MRYAGWERVRFVRYQSARQAKGNYGDVREMRKQGLVPGGYYAVPEMQQMAPISGRIWARYYIYKRRKEYSGRFPK
jgi:hypothetical protein